MSAGRNGKDARTFWNGRAAGYPRFEEGENNCEFHVLRTIREMGVDFHGKSVLDVGCGSGKYTLRLAREAASVVATDISDEMLRILREDAAALGLGNVECVQAEWESFALERNFDIVFASMTPAASTDAGREKLARYAGGKVVYVGFDRHTRSDVVRGLQERYNISEPAFNDVKNMRAWLEGKGIHYTAAPVTGRRVRFHTREALVQICSAYLREHGVSFIEKDISEYVSLFRDDSGNYAECTDCAVEAIVWPKG